MLSTNSSAVNTRNKGNRPKNAPMGATYFRKRAIVFPRQAVLLIALGGFGAYRLRNRTTA